MIRLKKIQIKPEIYWVGGIDWNLRNFHGYSTNRGTTYNAYLIIDKKITEIGYYTASVEYKYDIKNDVDLELSETCIHIFNDLVNKIPNLKLKKISSDEAGMQNISYKIAQKSGLTLKEKYTLLSLKDENERLEFMHKHLLKIIPLIKEVEFIQKVVKNDGYYSPNQ